MDEKPPAERPESAPYTLDQLVSFLAVVEAGSFSAAARRLGRVQSAVSYGIAQLERALDTQLFDRGKRTPVLTTAGQRLAAEARLVLAQARELTETATGLRKGIEPSLRVVVDAAYPSVRLLEVCATFRSRFPKTMLRLDIGLLGDAVEAVVAGEAELGACNLAGAAQVDLALEYLGTVYIVPVCAADHPLAALRGRKQSALLAQSIQIVQSERSRALTADQGVLATRTWRVTDLGTKAELIRRGVGWGSLPRELAEPAIARGELVRLAPERWPAHGHEVWLHAAVRRDRTLGPAGLWFREQLRFGDAGATARAPKKKVRRARR
jgi:DNA-binding transcriptional LysR family regulator